MIFSVTIQYIEQFHLVPFFLEDCIQFLGRETDYAKLHYKRKTDPKNSFWIEPPNQWSDNISVSSSFRNRPNKNLSMETLYVYCQLCAQLMEIGSVTYLRWAESETSYLPELKYTL